MKNSTRLPIIERLSAWWESYLEAGKGFVNQNLALSKPDHSCCQTFRGLAAAAQWCRELGLVAVPSFLGPRSEPHSLSCNRSAAADPTGGCRSEERRVG